MANRTLMPKSAAWPLSLVYVALIVFASLFPFAGWRAQGIDPWVFLFDRLPPHYWTGFDVASNVAGYVPLGFLLAIALTRTSGIGRSHLAVPLTVLAGAVLSLGMEFLQIYLPKRVPSNLDLLLNIAGSLVGALSAFALERKGLLEHWSRFRDRWFTHDAHGALVLLALWPWALLFPAAEPFGLGQLVERLEGVLEDWLDGTPFLEWLPVRDSAWLPLSPASETVCVAFGLLVPCLLAFSITRPRGKRAVLLLLTALVGMGATALSSALSWGPAHAWAWLSAPVQAGIVLGLALAAAASGLRARACGVLMLVVLSLHLAMLNNAPTSAYFAQTLIDWEQGRFIRFYGIGQWLGWLWPFSALLYMLRRSSRRTLPERAERA